MGWHAAGYNPTHQGHGQHPTAGAPRSRLIGRDHVQPPGRRMRPTRLGRPRGRPARADV